MKSSQVEELKNRLAYPHGRKAKGIVKTEMHAWKAGDLHSGSPKGPVVTSQKQAIAIALSKARKGG